MLHERRRESESKEKEEEKEGGDEGRFLRMDHGFLCPPGVYSIDRGTCYGAVDARVLMDMPDVDEKKSGFSRRRLYSAEEYL